MASNKSTHTSLPHSNCPKLPTGSSLKHSTSDDLSMRRNFKRPAIESSQIGDEIEDQDAIFKPWQNLSNPPNNVDEESDVVVLLGYDILLLLCYFLNFWSMYDFFKKRSTN